MKCAQPDDWKTEPMPAANATVALDGRFSDEEMERIRCGLIPEAMEDKWFIYWLDGVLHCYRSWTGYCVYLVSFVTDTDSWRMVRAKVNRDPAQYKETRDERDAHLIPYLIDTLLLGRGVDYPSDGPDEVNPLAVWGLMGRAMLGQGPSAYPARPGARGESGDAIAHDGTSTGSRDEGIPEPSVTLRNTRDDLGTRYLSAQLKADGTLVIQGQDLGKGVEGAFGVGNTEYEWAWTVRSEDVPDLTAALDAGDDVLTALAQRFSNDAAAGLKAFLGEHGIRHETWSRVGD